MGTLTHDRAVGGPATAEGPQLPDMEKKIGLALSGGGFRATLFHLGLVRFLHDAGILKNVSHITSVSGGSIIAAHLALNWGRYTASAREFNAAASELLSFIRLDVRNRILRRFPLAYPLRGIRSLVGLPNRKFTRTGLLEDHYAKFLYGDTSLFQLPQNPDLHLLSTNLSEGHLCSFNREGLWMIGRSGNHVYQIDRVPLALATVPMAVTASSAFAGFFPPLVLTGADVGSTSGEFERQTFTDGGVFDNLGVRMFHCLAQASGADHLPWNGVLVSDAGRPFEIQSSMRIVGMVQTAMRASDILMDRVWQLETETFKDTQGFVFARITDVVDQEQDPTALHPEVQRQLPNIRTDLDRFSELEINDLMRHGYSVGRARCRAHSELFGVQLADQPMLDPPFKRHATTSTARARAIFLPRRKPATVAASESTAPASTIRRSWMKLPQDRDKAIHATRATARAGIRFLPRRTPTVTTVEARTLHSSAVRRIWSTLLDRRDWVSYVYVPIILPVLVLIPYFAMQYYQRSHRLSEIVASLVGGSRDLQQMTQLLAGLPKPFTGEKAEELSPNDKVDLKGFTILQGLHVVDLRRWSPAKGGKNSIVYTYRSMKVRKEPGSQNNNFRVSILALSQDTQVRFPPQQLELRLYSRTLTKDRDNGLRHWEVGADFQKVPEGESIDVVYEHFSHGVFVQPGVESTSLVFDVEADTMEQMPPGEEYRTYELLQYPTGRPDEAETVRPVTEFRSADFKILAFKLLGLKAGSTYEITWFRRR